jgi:TusA-related sulfurtransferase
MLYDWTLPCPGPYPEVLRRLRELSVVALMEVRTNGRAAPVTRAQAVEQPVGLRLLPEDLHMVDRLV